MLSKEQWSRKLAAQYRTSGNVVTNLNLDLTGGLHTVFKCDIPQHMFASVVLGLVAEEAQTEVLEEGKALSPYAEGGLASLATTRLRYVVRVVTAPGARPP